MPAASRLQPNGNSSKDEDTYRLRDRSPHPYFNVHPEDADQDRQLRQHSHNGATDVTPPFVLEVCEDGTGRRSHQQSGTTSESGTEADDERPRLLRALPPPAFRPRKGLKHTDGTVSPLLTPSQLDQEGQRLSNGYFEGKRRAQQRWQPPESELEEERRKFATRRRAERIRRVCEGALVAIIGLVVAYGAQVWRLQWPWYLVEVSSQVLAIAGLVAFYPLRLISIEHEKGHLHVWSRFRIPPSFDPATVLYPTFLPVLVSLSLLPQNSALVLPNLILGLASLPARLFPAWSWRTEVNVLHWLVSLVPLFVSELINLAVNRFHTRLTFLLPPPASTSPRREALVLLYPLHQALLPALHYLTTTSLLPSEKQLLSSVLINLLLFASSPQITILSSVLWIGSIASFVLLGQTLRWNVALARVPSWRLQATARSQSSKSVISDLVGSCYSSLTGLISSAMRNSQLDSDADDEPHQCDTRRQRAPSMFSKREMDGRVLYRSATRVESNGITPTVENLPAKRRNTISSLHESLPPLALIDSNTILGRSRSRRRDWVLGLTPAKATARKLAYATYFYVCVVGIILMPIRATVAQYALQGSEPVLWAIHYLFGDLPSFEQGQAIFASFTTDLTLVKISSVLDESSSVLDLSLALGAANIRLLVVAYWLLVLGIGLIAVLLLSAHIEVDTRRKIFHGIMVTMFLPTIFIDPCFAALALSLVLAIFLLLEIIRAGQIPPLGSAIGRFVAPYVDGRDLRGPMVVSHVFLLIGCAIPMWLSLASFDRTTDGRWPGWEIEDNQRQVAMIAGVVCVGMGDAAASLIGRRYGRRKWPWIGGKSLEGSAAFAVAVTIGLMAAKAWLYIGGWNDVYPGYGKGLSRWAGHTVKAFVAGCGASFMEAVLTGANDNVVVPIALWLLVRGLRL